MALDGKVTLPVFGEVDKKYAVVGAVTAGGIVAVVYIRRKSKATAAASAAAGTSAAAGSAQTDPAGNVGVIDPQSGYVYGSPEDTNALQGSSYGGYSGYGGAYGGYAGNIDPLTGYPSGSVADTQALAGQTGTGGVSGSGISSNSSWLTEAVSVVPGDPQTVTAALASVLGGLTVTQDQKNLFMEAVGILGPPPGGYPTPIKTSDTAGQPSTGQGGGGLPGPGKFARVPDVVGENNASAFGTLTAAGFLVRSNHGGSPVGAADTRYRVVSQTPGPGANAPVGSYVALGVN